MSQLQIKPLPNSVEFFTIRNKLVATQPAKLIGFNLKPWNHFFFCQLCGEVFGSRMIHPASMEGGALYSYQVSKCKKHGGDETLLLEYEWQDLTLINGEVLAFTFYQLTGEENAT